MIRTSIGSEDHIPVEPDMGSMIEVPDNLMGIVLCMGNLCITGEGGILDTPF